MWGVWAQMWTSFCVGYPTRVFVFHSLLHKWKLQSTTTLSLSMTSTLIVWGTCASRLVECDHHGVCSSKILSLVKINLASCVGNARTCNNVVYIYPCIVPSPGFSFFKGLFLEAAWVVLFYTTAIHHHGRDIEDPLLFILERVLQICPQFKVPFSH